MKVSASKKTIAILIVLFLLLLLGGIYFLYKDVIHNGIKYGRWFTVDKYEELLDDCEWERKDKELKIKCRALVEAIHTNNDYICYTSKVISKINTRLIKQEICELPKDVHLNNPYFELPKDQALPSYLTIYMDSPTYPKYSLKKLVINGIKDEEVAEWLKNETLQNNLTKENLFLLTNTSYNGFLLRDNYLFPTLPLNWIRLYHMKLEEIVSDDNSKGAVLVFSGAFKNRSNRYKLKLYTESFAHSNVSSSNKMESYPEQGSISEILKVNNSYDLDLTYPTSSLSVHKPEITKACSIVDELSTERQAFCNIVKEGREVKPYEDIKKEEDFISFVIKNQEIVLDNMILNKVLNLEIEENE